MKFVGNVSEEGVLTIVNRKDFDAYIKDFSGKQITIEVTKKLKSRTNPQNAYYWSCVIPIVQAGIKDLGHRLTREETHLFLKTRFLKKELADENGESIGEIIRSTKDLSTSEFMDYMAEIGQFSAEILNVYIPEPSEQVKLIN